LAIDHGWKEVAEYSLKWLNGHRLWEELRLVSELIYRAKLARVA